MGGGVIWAPSPKHGIVPKNRFISKQMIINIILILLSLYHYIIIFSLIKKKQIYFQPNDYIVLILLSLYPYIIRINMFLFLTVGNKEILIKIFHKHSYSQGRQRPKYKSGNKTNKKIDYKHNDM